MSNNNQPTVAEYNIKITATDLMVIGNALGNLPYKDVAALLGRLQTQINEQELFNAKNKSVEAQTGEQTPPAA